MRWIPCMTVLILFLSCQSCQSVSSATPVSHLPAAPQLSSRAERDALTLPLAASLNPEQRAMLVELLKLWAIDVAELLAYVQELRLLGDFKEASDGR